MTTLTRQRVGDVFLHDRPLTPADNIQVPQADQAEKGQNENNRNPSREAKHQQDLLKDYISNLGALAG